jgi:hypothetical protein
VALALFLMLWLAGKPLAAWAFKVPKAWRVPLDRWIGDATAGLTGVTTADGRFTIMMPHPERTHRTVQMSWAPATLGEDAPWMRMFRNARRWLG